MVKLHCEACGYALFRDGALLKNFRLQRVMMQDHLGGAQFCEKLVSHGNLVNRNHRDSVQKHTEPHSPWKSIYAVACAAM